MDRTKEPAFALGWYIEFSINEETLDSASRLVVSARKNRIISDDQYRELVQRGTNRRKMLTGNEDTAVPAAEDPSCGTLTQTTLFDC